MKYIKNLKNLCLENDLFRKVITTEDKAQLVLMSLKSGEDIGLEVHKGHDQFIYIVEGVGEAIVGDESLPITAGFSVFIPSGVKHNVTNTSTDSKMKLFTTYSPPEHEPETTQSSK